MDIQTSQIHNPQRSEQGDLIPSSEQTRDVTSAEGRCGVPLRSDSGNRYLLPSLAYVSSIASKRIPDRFAGQGQYAQVFSATKKDDPEGKPYAVKLIDKKDTGASTKSVTDKEIEVMIKVNHPSCVNVYEIFETPEQVHQLQSTHNA